MRGLKGDDKLQHKLFSGSTPRFSTCAYDFVALDLVAATVHSALGHQTLSVRIQGAAVLANLAENLRRLGAEAALNTHQASHVSKLTKGTYSSFHSASMQLAIRADFSCPKRDFAAPEI